MVSLSVFDRFRRQFQANWLGQDLDKSRSNRPKAILIIGRKLATSLFGFGNSSGYFDISPTRRNSKAAEWTPSPHADLCLIE